MHNLVRVEDELARFQDDLCKGMAHPKRMKIIMALESGEKSVNELARLTGVPQANVSQHLALLRQLGVLSTRREGTRIYYSVADPRIAEACELVRSCAGERLKRSQLAFVTQH